MDIETKLTSSEEYVKNKRIKKMTLIDRIKYEITDFVKDIRFYLDLEKPDLDQIETLKRDENAKQTAPLVQLSSKGRGTRMYLKRR